MELLKMIKEMQGVLMASAELPHVVNIRLLARLDEAERHLTIAPKAPVSEAPKTPVGELSPPTPNGGVYVDCVN